MPETRGILFHAHNNGHIDYALIALCNALMTKRHLNVPVCLITNNGSLDWLKTNHGVLVNKAFDHIVIQNQVSDTNMKVFNDTASTKRTLRWNNMGRSDSYVLSPFDQTLLLDVDYLIMDNTLKNVWDSVNDVMINRTAIPLDHMEVSTNERWLEHTGIEMCWATCVFFRKSMLAERLFDMVEHIKRNYNFYSMVYGFPNQQYRNDYVFSIAVHMMSGFTKCDDIATLPYPYLFTSFDCDELIDVPSIDSLTLLMNDRKEKWKFLATRTNGISVHVHNKFSIIRQAEKIIKLYSHDQIV